MVGTKMADAIRYGEPGRYRIGPLGGGPGRSCRAAAGGDRRWPWRRRPQKLVAAVADAVDADGVALPGVSGPAGTASRYASRGPGGAQIAA